MLFLARIIDGASGASVSVAQAAVTDVAPQEDRARLLGLLGAAFGAGFALGPAIGGIAALVSHRLPFFIAAAIAGVNALVAVKRLPETRDHSRGNRGRSPDPIASSIGVRRLVLVTFVSLVAFSGFEATFSLLAEARFNLSESSTYGLFFLVGIGLMIVQGGAIHTVVVRLGELRTARLGLACNAIGLSLVAVDAGWAPLTLALALLIVGQGLVSPTLSALVAGRASEDRRGEVLGIQQSAGGLARSVGPALAGYLFGQSISAPYLVGAALVTIAIVLITDR